MKIDVRSECGEDVISRKAGKKIRDLILSNWNENLIEIVLGPTPNGSASFFDEAFALLLKRENKNIKELQSKLRFVDITSEDKKILNYVLMARVTEQKMNTGN